MPQRNDGILYGEEFRLTWGERAEGKGYQNTPCKDPLDGKTLRQLVSTLDHKAWTEWLVDISQEDVEICDGINIDVRGMGPLATRELVRTLGILLAYLEKS